MEEDEKRREGLNRKYTRLSASLRDFKHVKSCAEFLVQKKWFGWHRSRHRPNVRFQIEVYLTSLVVSYGRSFTDSKGLPVVWGILTRNYNNEEKAVHSMLLDLRHKVYAHTDGSEHQQKLGWTVFSDGVRIGPIEKLPMHVIHEKDLAATLSICVKNIAVLTGEIAKVRKGEPITRYDTPAFPRRRRVKPKG